MKGRYMRMILFFDLPTTSAQDRKVYADFRKRLLKEGFVMMQFSVYSKLVLNPTAMKHARDRIDKIIPTDGVVQMLCVTEKQFASMEYFVGEPSGGVIQTMDRTVVL